MRSENNQFSVLSAACLRSFGSTHPLRYSKKSITGWGRAPQGVKAASVDGLNPDHYEIRYIDGSRRALRRFDFATEWNNLGYGTITFGDSLFSIPALWHLPGDAHVLARIHDVRSQEAVGDYAAVFETSEGLSLWFARPVGPVDGFDWKWVEWFVSEEQVPQWGGCPVLADLPPNYNNGFTMRLDCDENIASARPLFELYKSRGVPLSLAIKTDQPLGSEEVRLLTDILASGGSVISHSHTHAPDWGFPSGHADIEIQEARKVLSLLKLPGINLEFAVSPFHQNSRGAVEALHRNGIRGFVGGIACNDPEFLMARSGQVPFVDGIISISHQCMLHGDCFHKQGSKLSIEKEAFHQSIQTGTLFGYLDHPFSSYTYGWKSEDERLQAHSEFLQFLLDHNSQWRPNLEQAMNFVQKRSQIRIRKTGPSEWEFEQKPTSGRSAESICLRMAGKSWVLS